MRHPPDVPRSFTRRAFLRTAASGLVLAGGSALADEKPKAKGGEPEIGPAEDLMREHGVLRRVLLVYGEAVRRIRAAQPAPTQIVVGGAALVRRFVEDYHEKQEEESVFPRFERANKLKDLVATLKHQHQVGRRLTDEIRARATSGKASDHPALIAAIESFAHMYRAHAAREDTVLFPAFHAMTSEREWDALGDEFEDNEKKILGEHGFEKAVDEVAKLEDELGIGDLASYTPADKR